MDAPQHVQRLLGPQHGELAVKIDRSVELAPRKIHLPHIALLDFDGQAGAQLPRVPDGGRAEVDADDRDALPRQLRRIQPRSTCYVEYLTPLAQGEPVHHDLHQGAELRKAARGRAMTLIQVLGQHALAELGLIPREVFAIPPGNGGLRAIVERLKRRGKLRRGRR